MHLSWLEISRRALVSNVESFRGLLPREVTLGVAVKANAYGHGLVECATVFAAHGADYLCVNALFEAEALRKAGLRTPLLVMGYTPVTDLAGAAKLKCELIVYNPETIAALGKLGKPVDVHLKIETGNHRQGVRPEDLPSIIILLKRHKNITLKGVSTHFANLEDRVTHQYALHQVTEFNKAIRLLEEHGLAPRFRHCANTAATLLLPEAHFNFVRLGIGAYGLWPSEKTAAAARRAGIRINLEPAMTWKTLVAQVKEVKKGALVGYGCTYEMPRDGRIAVLPVGYYDGYLRAHSNKGHVLVRGRRAPVVGRICMNMMMVDISEIPNVRPEDEVVLLGKQGKETVTAEMLADWSGTINYEVTTRIRENTPRIFV